MILVQVPWLCVNEAVIYSEFQGKEDRRHRDCLRWSCELPNSTRFGEPVATSRQQLDVVCIWHVDGTKVDRCNSLQVVLQVRWHATHS